MKKRTGFIEKKLIVGIIVLAIIVLIVILFLSRREGKNILMSETCPGPNCKYANYSEPKFLKGTSGKTVEEVTLENYTDDYTTLKFSSGEQRQVFLAHILDSDGKIERAFACGINDLGEKTEKVFCVEGTLETSSILAEVFESNKKLLQSSIIHDNMTWCTENDSNASCTGIVDVNAYSNGNVSVRDDFNKCSVLNSGEIKCTW